MATTPGSWASVRGGLSLAIAVVSVLFVAVHALSAGAATGMVTGVVNDASERPLAGVAVRLESSDAQVIARTSTDEEGRFVFTDVPAGAYTVFAEREGYDTGTVTGVVSDEERWNVILALSPRPVLESVVVTARRLEDPRIVSTPPAIGAPVYKITEPGHPDPAWGREQQPDAHPPAGAGGHSGRFERRWHPRAKSDGQSPVPDQWHSLPEGTTLFGQSSGLSPRLAESVTLLAGALPAEYGLRTSGVLDIQTKSGALEPGGYAGMYVGSQSWIQPSAEYGGTRGAFSYFLTADYLQNSIGISPATPNGAIHDDTQQGHAFGYFELALDSTSKVAAIVGTFVGHFQIPNSPGTAASFTVDGVSSFNSAKVDETQLEQNYFGIVSYRTSQVDTGLQVAAYARYGSLGFNPDPLADLLFNGIAQRVQRSSIATGLQADGRYSIGEHTLRAGMLFSAEQTSVQSSSLVLPAADGVQTSDQPIRIFNSTGQIGYTESLYLQDEWKITPSFTVNGGLRLDAYSSFRNEWQLSPRLSVVWQPTTTTVLHAGYARYFTPPRQEFVSSATFAKFADTTAAPEVPQNSAPRAERANYLDAGITQQIVPGFKVGLDGYYKQAAYQLDEGQFGAPVFLTPFNYQRAYTLGIELSTTVVLGNFRPTETWLPASNRPRASRRRRPSFPRRTTPTSRTTTSLPTTASSSRPPAA